MIDSLMMTFAVRRRSGLLLAAALWLAAGLAAANPLPASDCPLGTYPCFWIQLGAAGNLPGFYQFGVAPVSHSITGLNGPAVSSASGVASLGRLSARATGDSGSSTASASSIDAFEDTFVINNFSVSYAILSVSFAIRGATLTSGSGSGSIQAQLILTDEESSDRETGFLSSPGTTTVFLTLLPGQNTVLMDGILNATAYALGPGAGRVDVDYSHTYGITGVSLLDSRQQLLAQLSPVDLQGDSLPVGPLPEPTVAALVGAALAGLALSRRLDRAAR
jgi:hypothetical protein